MRPRYADLFRRMRSDDINEADAAYDAVLFDREEAIPDIMECYQKSKRDAVLRFLCVQLLGFTGSLKAIPGVIDALMDAEAEVRAEACRALEDLGATDAIPALERHLTDQDPLVREMAREALDGLSRPQVSFS